MLNNNKIAKPDKNTRNVENNYSSRKKRNIKQIKTSIIIKMEQYKISNLLLNDSIVSKIL